MASPFTVFRRNQKVMLAVTGILAMIAFVFIGPTCMQMGGTVGGGDNTTVVSWNYGSIHEGEMFNRMQMRRMLNRFLREAALLAGEPLQENYQRFDASEQGVVTGMVLTQLGKDLGMIVSDDTVNLELAQWTGNRVRPGDLEQVIARLGQQRVSSQQIFEGLRQEFLAERVYQLWLAGSGIDPILRRGEFSLDPPAQRWENFLRLEQNIVAQVMPVPVAEFTDQVAEPTEAELREFFVRHKEREPLPGSPEPGFRQPYRAKFQFFKADMEAMVTAAMPQVTDEEIREYYEKNKDTLFRASTLPALDETKEPPKSDETKADETKGDDAKADEIESKPDARRAGDEGDRRDQETRGRCGQTHRVERTDAESDEPASNKSSSRVGTGKFRLVNFQDEKAAAVPAEKNADEAPATGDEKRAEKKDGEKGQDDAPAKEDAAKESADAAETKDAKSEETKSDETSSKPVEYKPLEKVSEEIRRSLARQRVPQRVQDKFEKLRGLMTNYARSRTSWMIERSTDPDLPPPKSLNFETLAQDNRVQAFSTEMLSRADAATSKTLDIAKSFDRSKVASFENLFRMPWTSAAFEPGGLYKPGETFDPQGNQYLWWKTDEREARVPSFEEIKAEVLEAYKMFHARDKAVAQARQYAKQVKAASKNMKDLFADDKDLPVTQTEPFTWLTGGNVPSNMGQLRISDVKGVEMAGEEFMRTAYSLEPGEAGAALNAPKTVAYVIQVIETTPSRLVLQKDFMTRVKSYDRFRAAASGDLTDERKRWLDSLYEKYGVHWERPPEEPRAMTE